MDLAQRCPAATLLPARKRTEQIHISVDPLIHLSNEKLFYVTGKHLAELDDEDLFQVFL